MTTQYSDKRENFFLYSCNGVEATDSSYVASHLFRYFMVMSHILDLPEEDRGMYIDIGCGSGYGTELLGIFFGKSYGIDRDREALDYARKVHHRSGVEFIHNDDLCLHNFFDTADFISCIEVLEHVPQNLAEVLLAEIVGWLKPSGVLFLTTPQSTTLDGKNPLNPWHLHEYQPAELKALLEKFFGVVEIGIGKTMNVLCKEPKK